MSIHYYCLIHRQQILIHAKRNTILFEHEDFVTEKCSQINWKEVKSYRNGTQTIHYYTLTDDDARGSTLDFIKNTAEVEPTWLPFTEISTLNKNDLVSLAYISEGEILNPESEAYWIDLAKSLFTAQGQYWSPAHFSYCLRKRNKKALIASISHTKIQNILIWSLALGF